MFTNLCSLSTEEMVTGKGTFTCTSLDDSESTVSVDTEDEKSYQCMVCDLSDSEDDGASECTEYDRNGDPLYYYEYEENIQYTSILMYHVPRT